MSSLYSPNTGVAKVTTTVATDGELDVYERYMQFALPEGMASRPSSTGIVPGGEFTTTGGEQDRWMETLKKLETLKNFHNKTLMHPDEIKEYIEKRKSYTSKAFYLDEKEKIMTEMRMMQVRLEEIEQAIANIDGKTMVENEQSIREAKKVIEDVERITSIV